MAISFPSSPITNQTYTYNNKIWTYNGTRWVTSGANLVATNSPVVPITATNTTPGATTTGSIWIDTDSGTLSVYVGGAWVLASAGVLNTSANTIPGNSIVDSSITASQLAPGAAVPTQDGHSGKYLTTDGTTASWATAEPANGSITTAQLATDAIARITGYNLVFGR